MKLAMGDGVLSELKAATSAASDPAWKHSDRIVDGVVFGTRVFAVLDITAASPVVSADARKQAMSIEKVLDGNLMMRTCLSQQQRVITCPNQQAIPYEMPQMLGYHARYVQLSISCPSDAHIVSLFSARNTRTKLGRKDMIVLLIRPL